MVTSLFQSPDFLSRSNIYEVNIRQYTPEGTFNVFAKQLPRLKDMGVEIIWLMPVHPIGEVNRKGSLGSYYSAKDYKAVNPEFGTEQDLHSLIAYTHSLGMKLIIDWVANHTAWDHVWTKTNPEFYLHKEDGSFAVPFDWDDVIQIDHSNAAEQEAMTDAMRYWIETYDIDGFRADMAHLTPLAFWKNARTLLSPLKKDLIWLAESEDISYHEAFDISYAWDWMHKTADYCTGKISFADMLNVLSDYKNNFPENAMHLFFTANHDENSWNGTEYEKYDDLAKALAVFSCTYNSAPLIYSGQELPNNKRLKFFDKDEIEWTDNIELHQFYKMLLSLRQSNKAIMAFGTNELQLLNDGTEKHLLAYSAKVKGHALFVCMNLGTYPSEQNFIAENLQGSFRNIFTGEEINIDRSISVNLQRGEFIVLSKEDDSEL